MPLLAALLPSPLAALSAAYLLTKPRRLALGERSALAALAKISTIALAMSAMMFASSVLWFALSEVGIPVARSHQIGWSTHLRHLTVETVWFAIELFVALSIAEAIPKFFAPPHEDTAPIERAVASNRLRASLALSFLSTKVIIDVAVRAITEQFYDPFKLLMIILFTSLYTAADLVLRAARLAELFVTFPAYALEIATDFVIASLSDAFVWTPAILIWSALLIAVDIAARIVKRLARSFVE